MASYGDSIQRHKTNKKALESKLEGTVNYRQFVACTLDAAKQNERVTDPATTVARRNLFRPPYGPIY